MPRPGIERFSNRQLDTLEKLRLDPETVRPEDILKAMDEILDYFSAVHPLGEDDIWQLLSYAKQCLDYPSSRR